MASMNSPGPYPAVAVQRGMSPQVFQQLYDKDPNLAELYQRAFRPGKDVVTVLTVSEVERLAKAGVQIKFEDIADRVGADPNVVGSNTYQRANHLVHLFRERLMNRERVKQAGRNDYDYGGQTMVHMPDCWAAAYKDKVFLFVAPGNSEPLILEDDAQMYPSDALLAKYDLLLETLKATGDQRGMDGSGGTPTQSAPQTSPPVGSLGVTGRNKIAPLPYNHNG